MLTKSFLTLVSILIFFSRVNAQNSEYATNNILCGYTPKTSFHVSLIADSIGLSLRVYNPRHENLQVRISHKELGTAIDTSFRADYFGKRYMFGEAVDGNYIIEVGTGKEIYRREMELGTVAKKSIVLQ